MLLIEKVEDLYNECNRRISTFYFREIKTKSAANCIEFLTTETENNFKKLNPESNNFKSETFLANRQGFIINNKMMEVLVDRRISLDHSRTDNECNKLNPLISRYLSGGDVSGEYRDERGRITKIVVIQ